MLLLTTLEKTALVSNVASALGICSLMTILIATVLEIVDKGWLASDVFDRAFAYIFCTGVLGAYNVFADIYHIPVPSYIHWLTFLMAIFAFSATGSPVALECNVFLLVTLSMVIGKESRIPNSESPHMCVIYFCFGTLCTREIIYRIRKNRYAADEISKIYIKRYEYTKGLENRIYAMSAVMKNLQTRVYEAETKHMPQSFKELHPFYIPQDRVSEVYYQSRVAELTSQIHFFSHLIKKYPNAVAMKLAPSPDEEQLLKEFNELSEDGRKDKLQILKQRLARLEHELSAFKASVKQENKQPESPTQPTE